MSFWSHYDDCRSRFRRKKKRGEWEGERARRILNKRQKNPHDLWVGRTLKKNITTKKFCVWKERELEMDVKYNFGHILKKKIIQIYQKCILWWWWWWWCDLMYTLQPPPLNFFNSLESKNIQLMCGSCWETFFQYHHF